MNTYIGTESTINSRNTDSQSAAFLLNKNRPIKVVQITDSDNSKNTLPVKVKVDPKISICIERAELVTESYKETEGLPWIIRRARALDNILRKMTIYILPGEQIVGNYASTPHSLPTYPEISCRWLDRGLDDEFKSMLSETDKIRLKEINKYWYNHNVEGAILKSMPDELERYINLNMASAMFTRFWPAGCLTSNFHDWVFPRGLRGILHEIDQYRKKLSKQDPDFKTKIEFYEAAEITINAVIAFAHRYAELARKRAGNTNGKLKEDYLRIADICERIPEFPPESFHEALQCFYFCHLVTSQIEYFSDGLGQRFDQIFYPFYKMEKERGTITYERAVELFEFLFIKLDDLGQINPITTAIYQAGGTKFQDVSVGGVDSYGNDATNELSFAVIDATMKIRTPQPAICLLYHKNINPSLVDKAIDCIGTGMGMPAIFNDEVAIKWHLIQTFKRLFPESGAYVGVPCIGMIMKIVNSPIRKAFARFIRAMLPKTLNIKIDTAMENLPYNVCAGWGKTGDILRWILKKMNLFDAEKAIMLGRNWAPTSCVGGGVSGSIVMQGTLTSILILSVLNFLKCFEFVMYQGKDPQTGEQIGVRTPDPCSFKSYKDFLDAFLLQLKYQVEQANKAYKIVEMLYEEMMPRPFASSLVETPIMRGRDAMQKGDTAISEIFSMGSINAGNSLAVVKKLVFDEKSVSMRDLIDACRSNWKGYEDIHKKCLTVKKFGNDDNYTDMVIAEMYEKAHAMVSDIKDHWGRPLQLESSLAAGYYVGGLVVGATPDGRVKGETISDGQLSPMRGTDISGPTAVLKSCSRVNPLRSWNQLLNQKIHPSFVKGKNKKVFADYLRTWHSFNNWHIQINCHNAEDLKEAIKYPEKHRDLVVRVAGYSAYFTELAPGLQNDIIKRTEQDLLR